MTTAAVAPPGRLVIFGTGSLAQLLDFALRDDPNHEVVAFTSTADRITSASFLDRPVVPFEQVAERYPPSRHSMFVAIGYHRMNRLRSHFYGEARQRGYRLMTHVSPDAIHDGVAAIGDNCYIFGGATIEPFASIGNAVIIWSGAHVSHHSSVGDHSFVGPGAAIAGHTSVGRRCFLGVHATVRDGVSIGDDCLVGAGATVLGDIGPGQVLVGEGARPYPGDVSRFYE